MATLPWPAASPASLTAASSDAYPCVAAIADSADAHDRAAAFARRADIPLLAPEAGVPHSFRFLIRVSAARVVVECRETGFGAPVSVDWLTQDVRRRVRAGRRQPLARAIGLHRRQDLSVLDGTGGFGRDGFVLAALGARITLCERSAVMHALLWEATARAARESWTKQALERIDLVCADAAMVLDRGDTAFDVVYLDPMYPQRRKAALARKEMRLLRALVGDDSDAPALLRIALERARARVVVKRPSSAPLLADLAPHFSVRSKQVRYDVYLVENAPS